jgi:hypothetical protein
MSGFARIGGRQQAEVWKASQGRNILNAVMGVAHVSIRHSCADGDDSHGQIVVANIVADLFQASKRRKVSDAISEYMVTFGGKARGHASHILFGNSCIQESIGKFVRKWFDD